MTLSTVSASLDHHRASAVCGAVDVIYYLTAVCVCPCLHASLLDDSFPRDAIPCQNIVLHPLWKNPNYPERSLSNFNNGTDNRYYPGHDPQKIQVPTLISVGDNRPQMVTWYVFVFWLVIQNTRKSTVWVRTAGVCTDSGRWSGLSATVQQWVRDGQTCGDPGHPCWECVAQQKRWG